MVLCWRTAPINYTQRNFFVFIPKFDFLLCLVIKSEREDCVVGSKQQQGLQGGVTRVTLLCCQSQAMAQGWVTSPGTARSSCPAPISEGPPTGFKSFLTQICWPSISKELPFAKPLWPRAGGPWWPESVAAVPVAVSSCSSEGVELLTKVLCAQAPVCPLLEPIYALNSNPE